MVDVRGEWLACVSYKRYMRRAKSVKVSCKLDHNGRKLVNPASKDEYIVLNEIRPEGRTFGDNTAEYQVFGKDGKQDIIANGKEDATWRLILHVAGE